MAANRASAAASRSASPAAASAPAAVRPGARRLDLGRLIMVPFSAVLLLLDVESLTRGRSAAAGQVIGTGLVCAFYAMVIWSYLRRGPATATSGSVSASVVAVVATMLPFALPLLRGGVPPGWVRVAADLLLVAGTGWSLWALRWLGRNLSVLAQARGLTEAGPYRLVRHPLYAGEIVAALGVALTAGSLAAVAAWLGLCLMQAYRAYREELLLLAVLPGYSDYRARTAALIPGIF